MNRKKFVGIAATAALLTTAACSGGGGGGEGDTTGVTADTIKLGTTQPLTGPAAAGYSRVSKAMDNWFKYVNDNGGIHGRNVELVIEDDGYNPANTVTKTKQLVQKDKVFALVGALGTPTHTKVLDFIRQNKVPDLFVASGSAAFNAPETAPYTFGWPLDYIREGKIMGAYAKDELADKTYCSFGQADDLGADGAKGVERGLGESLKATETYNLASKDVQGDLATSIGKLKAAGCEVVFSFSIPPITSGALQVGAALNFKPQWVVASIGGDPAALKGAMADKFGLTEGIITTQWLAPVDDAENSWTKLFTKITEKYSPDLTYDFTMEYGYALAYTATQALLAAGEDLTRESLIEAIEKGGFEGPGLTPLALSADDHSGYTGTRIVQFKDGVQTSISDVFVTDTGDGAVETASDEPAEAPADGLPE